LDFFPKSKFTAPLSEAHRSIKIKHLLTMSSGLDAGEDNSKGNTGNWLTSKDWVNFALALPMIFKPGERWVYNDVCPMLIGAIIEETSGKTLAKFAEENLFAPLGIREYYWYAGPGGRTGPMGNLYISPLDFARIGELVVNKGYWKDKKIVSTSWINAMAQPQFDISKENPRAKSYGYFWYTGNKEVNGKTYEFLFASGNGGNLLFVVPAENLVVSLASSAYGQGYGHHRSFNIFDYVLRAIVVK
jgi:CubicO group peptidase (beta-lactamase class C family)